MKIFGWGANSYGQLGIGFKCEQLLTPTEIPFEYNNEKINSISGGAGHSIILTESGSLYSTGWNSKGQLGYNTESLIFKKITALQNYKIIQVSCGWDFSAAITENGLMFVWGSNAFGQINLPKHVKYTSTPNLLEISNVKYISCGMRHIALITKNGEVMICGSGNKGQLGLVDETKNIIKESTFQIIPNLEDVVSVACGQHHTIALKNDGSIYVWGDNKHGQLGLDPTIHNKIIKPFKLDLNISIVKIYTGWTHSAFLTENGNVYNFGRNTYGQLGEDRNCCWLPTKLNILNLKCLSLGSEHNLAINVNNELLSWGWNEHGNCGTGDTDDKKYPTKISMENISIYVAAGTGQSFSVM